MTAPYRNELETLEARKRVLEGELESIAKRIEQRRRLPLLDKVKIATPCPAKWENMVGDDRKRFCGSCEKDVFNISSLPREQAEQFLHEHTNVDGSRNVCLRFYQREDGTIMTSDCAVGVSRARRAQRRVRLALLAIFAVVGFYVYRAAACRRAAEAELQKQNAAGWRTGI